MSKRDKLRLIGPQKFNKNKQNELRDLKTATITNATLLYPDGKIFSLQQNWIEFRKNIEKRKVGRPSNNEKDKFENLYIYHAYDYLVNGEKLAGRWYDVAVPLNNFNNILLEDDDTFIYKCDGYEDEDEEENITTEFRITFNKNGVRKLKKFLSS